MSYLSDTVVIIDNGSGTCKAGFASDKLPNVVLPCVVGTPNRRTSLVIGLQRRNSYVGVEAQAKRGILTLNYPMAQDSINWDSMQEIWTDVFENKLRIQASDHPVLLTEPPYNSLRNSEKIANIMFETFEVPAVYLAMQSVLPIYASTCKTGIVLDLGHNIACSVPVYEGYAQRHAIQKLGLAGKALTENLVRKLMSCGHNFRTTAEMEIAREMKEKLCYVAKNYDQELTMAKVETYELPDGQVLSIGNERFGCAEALFQPEMLGRDAIGIHKMVFKSIMESDLRSFPTVTIILSGGTSLLPNITERLQREITALMRNDMKINVVAPANRQFAVWVGGSVLASTTTFRQMCVTSDEYFEEGFKVVQRNCL